MRTQAGFIQRIVRDEAGQDMVEYVLIFALVSIAALGAIMIAGPAIKTYWTLVVDQITAPFA